MASAGGVNRRAAAPAGRSRLAAASCDGHGWREPRCRGVKFFPEKARPWEIGAALFIALGMVVTIGWAVFETYWG
ncbi:MAG TPA: hypothetical protein VEA61_07510 [Allosphingosinicella sp.]|nr:hypothetical protein [Allosphingosinicella sp.]